MLSLRNVFYKILCIKELTNTTFNNNYLTKL